MNQTLPTLKVALLGCGVVGTEVARLLTEQADDLALRVGLFGEQPGYLGADDAAAEQGYLESGQGLIHPISRRKRSSRVSRRTMARAAPAPTATTAGRVT